MAGVVSAHKGSGLQQIAKAADRGVFQPWCKIGETIGPGLAGEVFENLSGMVDPTELPHIAEAVGEFEFHARQGCVSPSRGDHIDSGGAIDGRKQRRLLLQKGDLHAAPLNRPQLAGRDHLHGHRGLMAGSMKGSCTPEGNPIRRAKELHQRIQPEQGVWKSIDPIFGAENHEEAWMKPGYGSMAQLRSRDALRALGLQLLKTASQPSQQIWLLLRPQAFATATHPSSAATTS